MMMMMMMMMMYTLLLLRPFSTIQHARHLELDHVPTTRLRIETLHRIGTSMANDAPVTDDMFKLAIKTNSTRQQLSYCILFS